MPLHFTSLPAGEYVLEIKAYGGESLSIPFAVSVPFAARPYMVMMYAIVLIIVTGAAVHVKTSADKRREIDKLKRLQYSQLQEKVLALEKELKERMRLAVGRQELLDAIVSEIESQKQELGERYPNKLYYRLMRIVEDGRSQTGKMLSFENYFVEVHYDFMQRMQKLHPDLSPSELKFSCLVRANLTTKEMASILGIDIRSVELKKYRLKRKLGLDKDSRLISFILNV